MITKIFIETLIMFTSKIYIQYKLMILQTKEIKYFQSISF